MSAMEDMLASMLKKAMPPEVAALLTPEKINEFGERINAFLVHVTTQLAAIQGTQDEILKKMEGLENVGRNESSGSGSGDGGSDSASSGSRKRAGKSDNG